MEARASKDAGESQVRILNIRKHKTTSEERVRASLGINTGMAVTVKERYYTEMLNGDDLWRPIHGERTRIWR